MNGNALIVAAEWRQEGGLGSGCARLRRTLAPLTRHAVLLWPQSPCTHRVQVDAELSLQLPLFCAHCRPKSMAEQRE